MRTILLLCCLTAMSACANRDYHMAAPVDTVTTSDTGAAE